MFLLSVSPIANYCSDSIRHFLLGDHPSYELERQLAESVKNIRFYGINVRQPTARVVFKQSFKGMLL